MDWVTRPSNRPRSACHAYVLALKPWAGWVLDAALRPPGALSTPKDSRNQRVAGERAKDYDPVLLAPLVRFNGIFKGETNQHQSSKSLRRAGKWVST